MTSLLNYIKLFSFLIAVNFFYEAPTNNLQFYILSMIQKRYLPTSKSVLQLFQVLLFEVPSTSCPLRKENRFCYKRENMT